MPNTPVSCSRSQSAPWKAASITALLTSAAICMVRSVFTESLHNPSKELEIYGKKIILLSPELSLTHI